MTAPLGAALMMTALTIAPVHADKASHERTTERYDTRHGLRNPDITALAQDARGFLWIGSNGGLARFDGHTIVPWAVSQIRGRINHIAPSDDGLYVAEFYGYLWRVDGERATRVDGPDGKPVFSPTYIKATGRELMVAVSGKLWARRDGTWSQLFTDCFGGDPVVRVTVHPQHGTVVATYRTVWHAGADRARCPRKLGATLATEALLITPTGDVHALTFNGRWWRFHGGKRTLLHEQPMQGRDLVMRGDAIWASFALGLAVLRSGRPVQMSDTGATFRLLVDHEGSLWSTSSTGLVQYLEPDTIIYTLEREGHPRSMLKLTEAADGIVATTWSGSATLRDGDQVFVGNLRAERSVHPGMYIRDRLCRGKDGRLWPVGYGMKGYGYRAAGAYHRLGQEQVEVYACAETPRGSVWLATRDGLVEVATDSDSPVRIAALPWKPGRTVNSMVEVAGVVWLNSGTSVVLGADCTAERQSALELHRPAGPRRLRGRVRASRRGVVGRDDQRWALRAHRR